MTDLRDPNILQTQLEAYAARGLYPFHMPGHKRRMQPAPGLPAGWDVTEVPGTDDLHDAEGILRQAMGRTADLCGADRTWYLVNGSTCGLLAGIRALARRGSEVLCARNCHKAVYHALELSGYRVRWILPDVDPDWGICGGIRAEQVKAALRRHPSVKAVILTSPTYEGVLSELEEICRTAHARGIPVLVDEAHGAHLIPLSEKSGFPAGALACGADLVVQSPHKTLPSLTQTALLHLQGNLVDPVRIEEELDIFETSSPSYPLMASLDGCTGILRTQGEDLFERWALRLGRFEAAIRPLQRLRVLYHGPGGRQEKKTGAAGALLSLYDPGKILIDAGPAGMDGRELARILREEWRMETEMTQGSLVLAMTSLCDDEDALDRLAKALLEIDRQAVGKRKEQGTVADGGRAEDLEKEAVAGDFHAALLRLKPTAVCTLAEAAGQESEMVPLDRAAGRICAEYLYFYPPGIPVVAPGEVITRSHLDLLTCAGEEGAGLYRGSGHTEIRCLRE